jgi:hypothetical protein
MINPVSGNSTDSIIEAAELIEKGAKAAYEAGKPDIYITNPTQSTEWKDTIWTPCPWKLLSYDRKTVFRAYAEAVLISAGVIK